MPSEKKETRFPVRRFGAIALVVAACALLARRLLRMADVVRPGQRDGVALVTAVAHARQPRRHGHRDRDAPAQGLRRRRHAGLRAAEEAARGHRRHRQGRTAPRRDRPLGLPGQGRRRSRAAAQPAGAARRPAGAARARANCSSRASRTSTARTQPRPTRCKAPRRPQQSALAQVNAIRAQIQQTAVDPARRRGEPRLHQDLCADRGHRRLAGGEAGPDAERQPAGAHRHAHRGPVDDDGAGPGFGGRRAEAARRHGRLLHHAGRRQPPLLRQAAPDPAHADRGEQRRALRRAVRRGESRTRR